MQCDLDLYKSLQAWKDHKLHIDHEVRRVWAESCFLTTTSSAGYRPYQEGSEARPRGWRPPQKPQGQDLQASHQIDSFPAAGCQGRAASSRHTPLVYKMFTPYLVPSTSLWAEDI